MRFDSRNYLSNTAPRTTANPFPRADFNNSKVFAPLIFALAISLFAGACGGSEASSSDKSADSNAAKPKTVETRVAAAVSRDVPRFIQATGSFLADETTEVAPEIAGRVEAVFASEGSFVEAGTVIIRLSERDARLRLEQAQAAESQAVAAVRQAEAQVRQNQAQLGLDKGGNFSAANIPAVREARAALRSAESDLKLAQTNERRYSNLLETGDTSRLVYDQRRNELEKAQAAVAEARERLHTAENSARGGNQGVEAARANLETQRAALESARSATAIAEKTVRDTSVRAPFSGLISQRPAAVGEYVSPTASVATIVRVNPLKLRLNVPETEAGNVTIGMSVSANVAAYTDRSFAGRVSAINPTLDQAARTLQVEAVFDNPDNLLRPGMFAAARVLLPGGETGVFVPRAALVANQNTDSFGVYVIEGDTARLRIVQLDENQSAEEQEVRILSGVNADERVAIGNTNQLFDGAKVITGN